MRALIFFAQLLFWLLVIRLLLRGLARLFWGAQPASPRAAAAPPRQPIEDLVQDPVCLTYIPRSRALTATIAGREEHFCSPTCRDKAKAAAARAS